MPSGHRSGGPQARPRMALGALLAVLLIQSHAHAQASDFRARKAELRRGWAALDAGASHWAARGVYTNAQIVGGQAASSKSLVSRIEFKTYGSCWMADVQNSSPGGANTKSLIVCSNDAYSFTLSPSGSDGYFVSSLDQRKSARERVRKRFLTEFMISRLAYCLPDEPLTLVEVAMDDSFRVIDWREIPGPDGAGTRAAVVISYQPSGQGARRDPARRETRLIVEPQNHCRVLEAVTKNSATTARLRVQYLPNGKEFEVVEAVNEVDYGGVIIEERYELEPGEAGGTTASMFKLSAFEIAEPYTRRSYVPHLLTLSAFLIIGGAAWRMRDRRGPAIARPAEGNPV